MRVIIYYVTCKSTQYHDNIIKKSNLIDKLESPRRSETKRRPLTYYYYGANGIDSIRTIFAQVA